MRGMAESAAEITSIRSGSVQVESQLVTTSQQLSRAVLDARLKLEFVGVESLLQTSLTHSRPEGSTP